MNDWRIIVLRSSGGKAGPDGNAGFLDIRTYYITSNFSLQSVIFEQNQGLNGSNGTGRSTNYLKYIGELDYYGFKFEVVDEFNGETYFILCEARSKVMLSILKIPGGVDDGDPREPIKF